MDLLELERIVDSLSQLDVSRLTPNEALNRLRSLSIESQQALKRGRLPSALQSGRVATGIALFTCSPILVEVLGRAGFDFVIIDTEHTPLGTLESFHLQHLIRAARLSGITPVVRVSDNYAPMVQKALDAGAEGIIAPHVNTAEDARKLVRFSSFPPRGVRGACPTIPANRYFGNWNSYTEFCEREFLVIPLIEETTAVDNIEEIAAVDGLGFLWLGPFDLSVSMGITGQVLDPRITEARQKIIRASAQHNLPVADVAWDVDSARRLVDEGVRVLVFTADLWIFNQECQRIVQSVQEISQAKTVR